MGVSILLLRIFTKIDVTLILRKRKSWLNMKIINIYTIFCDYKHSELPLPDEKASKQKILR